MYHIDVDEHINPSQGYNSDSELSQKLLVQEIKQLVEESIERRVKRRTVKKRKRKEHIVHDRVDVSEEDCRAYNRCSIPYVHSVLKSINCSEHRKELVKQMGFQHMLQLDDVNVPRLFAQWIADHTIPDEEAIKIGDKAIPISPKSFQDILGIPAGDIPVESDEIAGKEAFLQLFGLSEVPSIRYFRDKIIMEEDLPDDVFCRCVMSVFLGAFICPNSSTRPSTKYMGALIVVDKIKHFNWAKFAYDWFMCYVRKYLKEKRKQSKDTVTLGGCIYHLAVRYLDFVEFGSIKLPSTIPRICVWKGKLIKHFSEMDKGKDGNYGNNPSITVPAW